MNELSEDIDYNDCIPFVPPIKSGKVIKVYDGDTITIVSKLPYAESPMYKFNVRINGIDCPEIKSKCKEEKKVALLAKELVSSTLLGKIVKLENVTTEKYGRILADVILEEYNIAQLLIDNKLAVEYTGGAKQKGFDWIAYSNAH